MTSFSSALPLAALLALATAASAQTPAQRDMIARDKLAVAEYAKRVNTYCGGTHIQFSVDYTPGAGTRYVCFSRAILLSASPNVPAE